MGDYSNNESEYEGAKLVLQHACRNIDANPVCFRFDSLLVARQLQGKWACRSPNLVPLYKRALHLLMTLRTKPAVYDVTVEHVYGEFNSDADGLANSGHNYGVTEIIPI